MDNFCGCKNSVSDVVITKYNVEGSIRAVEVLNDSVMWYAGSDGQYGYTEDGGLTWCRDSIKYNNVKPEFRSIAITDKVVCLLSVGSPALLFKSVDKGLSWDIVYKEVHPSCFYNSMAFWDDNDGIAVGDPVDSCLSVIVTNDGGNSWKKLPCDLLPSTFDGEAGFAASNTCIDVFDDHAWLVSGGEKARVFRTSDRGKSWQVFNTPIIQGSQMTGIFSVDFYDENNGVIFGGDWDNQSHNTQCKAVTNDGGVSWHLINDRKDPGFRSCVQFIPVSDGQKILAVGMPGISYSDDAGANWISVSNDSYYTIRISESGRVAWLAGGDVVAKMEW